MPTTGKPAVASEQLDPPASLEQACRILSGVDYQNSRDNLYVVAISIGFGMIPLVAPTFFAKLPGELGPILNSGILLTAISAVILNLYFTGVAAPAKAAGQA